MEYMTHTQITDVVFVVEIKTFRLVVDVVVVNYLVILVGGNVKHIYVLR